MGVLYWGVRMPYRCSPIRAYCLSLPLFWISCGLHEQSFHLLELALSVYHVFLESLVAFSTRSLDIPLVGLEMYVYMASGSAFPIVPFRSLSWYSHLWLGVDFVMYVSSWSHLCTIVCHGIHLFFSWSLFVHLMVFRSPIVIYLPMSFTVLVVSFKCLGFREGSGPGTYGISIVHFDIWVGNNCQVLKYTAWCKYSS